MYGDDPLARKTAECQSLTAERNRLVSELTDCRELLEATLGEFEGLHAQVTGLCTERDRLRAVVDGIGPEMLRRAASSMAESAGRYGMADILYSFAAAVEEYRNATLHDGRT